MGYVEDAYRGENEAGGLFQRSALAAVDHRQLARTFCFLLNT